MEDLFEVLKTAMYQYTHADSLTPRRQQTLMDTYSRYVYNFDVVDELVPVEKTEEDDE